MLYKIRFKATQEILECSFTLRGKEEVICEKNGELYVGTVVSPILSEKKTEGKVLRPLYPEEKNILEGIRRFEKEALEFCKERIQDRNLPMKLIDVEQEWDKKKIKFYFLAEHRIDFRELVKDLAKRYKTRIELRQIGVRDYAGFLGGIGVCGRPLCCMNLFKKKVSIGLQTAREQHVNADPNKISGVCGRLMCCFSYEYNFYKEENAKYPKIGSTVETPKGNAEVLHFNILSEIVKVKYPKGTEENIPLSMIKKKKMWWIIPKRSIVEE